MEKNTEKGNSSGVITVSTRENLKIIIYTETEHTSGQMEECTLANGSSTKCTEKEFLPGLMEGNMRGTIMKFFQGANYLENTLMTKKAVMECSFGVTPESIAVTG